MLHEIMESTKKRVDALEKNADLYKIDKKCKIRSLKDAIIKKRHEGLVPMISEIKPASPSEGVLADLTDVQVEEIAYKMQKAGACAISVLTEPEFFSGSLKYLKIAKKTTNVPILRKDFIISKEQIYESAKYCADAILLIASLIEDLESFIELTENLGMEALVEVHNKEEIERAVAAGASLIGINNRDFKTLKIDINTTQKLARYVPRDVIVVSESGITKKEDVDFVMMHADAILIGTGIMTTPDIEKTITEFIHI